MNYAHVLELQCELQPF